MTTIYHNPKCGTSRNTLALMREKGIEPTIIEYLKGLPEKVQLTKLLADTGLPLREIMRKNGPLYEELELGNTKWSDDQLIDFIIAHPILMNRPIVQTEKGVRLCRPKETVLEIL